MSAMQTNEEKPLMPRTASGATPLCLGREWGVWRVAEGAADLFLALVDEAGRPTSALHPLFRVAKGGVLWGDASLCLGDWSLIAVGTPGHSLVQLGRAPWRDSGESGLNWPNALDEWFAALAGASALGAVAQRNLPDPFAALPHSAVGPGVGAGSVALRAGRSCVQTAGLWLCLPPVADAEPVGNADLSIEMPPPASALEISGQDWLPCPAGAVLQAASAATVQWRTTAEVLADADASACLSGANRLHEACMSAMMLTRVVEAVLDTDDRLQSKRAREGVALAAATRTLASVLQAPVGPALVAPNLSQREAAWAPLLDALVPLGAAMGFKPHTPPGLPLLPAAEAQDPKQVRWASALRAAADTARLRFRRVTLAPGWWKHEAGPLLAFVGAGQRPVALIPRGGRYWCHDSESASPLPLDDALAASLHQAAFSLYVGFGDAPVTLLTLIRSGLRGLMPDVRTVLVCGALLTLLGLAMPLALGWLTGQVLPSGERGLIALLGLALVAAALTTALFEITRGIAHVRIESYLESTLQAGIWDRLLRLPVPFFRLYSAGDLGERGVGIARIRQAVSGATVSGALAAIFSLMALAVLFFLDPALAVLASMLIAGVLVAICALAGLALVQERQLAAVSGLLSGRMLQWLGGIAKLRATGTESRALWMWAQLFSKQQSHQLRAQLLHSGIVTLQSAFPAFATLVLFSAAAARLGANDLSAGLFVAFIGAFNTLAATVMSAAAAIIATLGVVPIIERARPILQAMPETTRARADVGPLEGSIELAHVSFRYQPDEPYVLNDVSLSIRAGEMVAIVGESGCGKSTLMRLLLGFEAPSSGNIFFDKHDLAGLDVGAVRRQMGVVLQNGQLMPGDIKTNIIGPAGLLTLEDAWLAAERAGVADDIRAMPMGMHTVMADGASTVSGGQLQRLMIARAIVGRPRILFFDEATSALDNRTQAKVSASLEQLSATRILIAHRLSTVVNADRIIVLEGGRVAQQGRYEELMAVEGPFRRLAQRQMI